MPTPPMKQRCAEAESRSEPEGKRARRERIALWLFLAGVLVLSVITGWLFVMKIHAR
jgi:hypothetical protein